MPDSPATQAHIEAVKELMQAHFKTVQVQLDTLARMAPDVEQLKSDVGVVKTGLASMSAKYDALSRNLSHMEDDFMPRDELLQTFVQRADVESGRNWTRSRSTLLIGGLGVLASLVIGVLNLIVAG